MIEIDDASQGFWSHCKPSMDLARTSNHRIHAHLIGYLAPAHESFNR